jgi:hypothetical protein
MKLILYSVIFFAFITANAQNSVGIPDTTLDRAMVYQLPVYIDTDDAFDNIRLVFQYDKIHLDIKGLEVSNSTIAYEINNFQLYDENGQSFFVADLNTNLSSSDNILFYISLEALVGPDSVTYIEIKSLETDNVPAGNYELVNGKISIRGESVYLGNLESLSLNYPNPFYYETKFDMNLDNESNISLKLYNTGGKLVATYPGKQNDVVRFLIRKDGIIVDDNTDALSPGKYEISLLPFNNRFSSGVYFFYLQTDKSIYKRNLIYQK